MSHYTSLLLALVLASCQAQEPTTHHIFYLHGRIVELQGRDAVHERFGPYQYDQILDSLAATNATLHSETRTADTGFVAFCEKTSNEINELIEQGTSPHHVTIIGASKGAVMAMYIANLNPNPINYVLLGANNVAIERENDWNLHGRILGIYEKSDELAGRGYTHWINRSTNATTFEQLQIETGLGHGFLYQPLSAWWEPAKAWMEGGSGQ